VVAETAGTAASGRALSGLAGELAACFPGALTDVRPRMLAAVVPVRSEGWAERLERPLQAALAGGAGGVAGYSEPARELAGLPAAYQQARVAAAIARAAGGERQVRGHAGLGAQRHVWTIAQAGEPDALERALAPLVAGGRGADLFRTLESYLDCQGNARDAAAALYIHRNTLRQRLRRISSLVGMDVTDPARWFDLSLAVRLIRFRTDADPLR